MKERAKILEEGGNPDEVILKKRHLEQQAKRKELVVYWLTNYRCLYDRKFEQEQKRKQVRLYQFNYLYNSYS